MNPVKMFDGKSLMGHSYGQSLDIEIAKQCDKLAIPYCQACFYFGISIIVMMGWLFVICMGMALNIRKWQGWTHMGSSL